MLPQIAFPCTAQINHFSRVTQPSSASNLFGFSHSLAKIWQSRNPRPAPLSSCFIQCVYAPDSGRIPGPGLLLRHGRLSGGAEHRSHGPEAPEQKGHRPGPGGAVQHLRGQQARIRPAGSVLIGAVQNVIMLPSKEISTLIAALSGETLKSRRLNLIVKVQLSTYRYVGREKLN